MFYEVELIDEVRVCVMEHKDIQEVIIPDDWDI